ncbi:maltose ABC transporter periplasmic protein [Roseibium album]|nr:maltose ABC transporter periplasmic protein [Roseibium album]
MKLKSVFLFLVLLQFSCPLAIAKTLSVSLIGGGEARTAYLMIGELFQKETGTRIVWNVKHDADYKDALENWFLGDGTPDVVYWQGGERLFQYVRKGWVEPITEFWNDRDFDHSYTPGIKGTVALDGDVYAIPFSYYHWGFYFRKSVFEKLGISPPADWDDLLAMCSVMKSEDMAPIVIGTRYNWPSAAWFDYLDLRINGLEFHRKLTRGMVPYTDARVQAVFEHWKQLLENDCFIDTETHRAMTWSEPLPYIYRGMAGTGLFGNFVTNEISPQFVDDFGFFPFPEINDVPSAEEAPTDLFLIAKKSRNKKAALKFLDFIARADVQEKLNNTMGTISTNRHALIGDDPFIGQGAKLLQSAEGVSQFFDRDTPKPMADEAVKIFTRFLETGDVGEAVNALEKVRKSVY